MRVLANASFSQNQKLHLARTLCSHIPPSIRNFMFDDVNIVFMQEPLKHFSSS